MTGVKAKGMTFGRRSTGTVMKRINDIKNKSQIDWTVIFAAIGVILGLWVLLMIFPAESDALIEQIRGFLGGELGFYYILIGLGVLLFSVYAAFSGIGKIRLGEGAPTYSNLRWGSMIFTSTMAADILFYSLCEWIFYAVEPQLSGTADIQKWAPTYTLFHWGPIPWGFYLVLAIAFGFMIHIRGRKKQKFSEACRPLLGKKVDGIWGTVIDLIAVISLLIGTGTTFSLTTPLLSAGVHRIFGFENNISLTLGLLLVIGLIYGVTVWFGMQGISRMAGLCCILFGGLLLYVLIGGNEIIYIMETGISSLGNLADHFIGLATWMDPLRENSFPQNWTIFYWSYWMVWCVATPFFIGIISKGRTIRNVVLGGYGCGLAGTFVSFIILGNYGLSQQLKGKLDMIGLYEQGESLPNIILQLFDTLPLSVLGIALLVITMIAFYATTFDTLTMVISCYTYKELPPKEEPDKKVRIFWSVMFLVIPIALIFHENSIRTLQSIAIISAFPIGIVFLLIVISFIKDVKDYRK